MKLSDFGVFLIVCACTSAGVSYYVTDKATRDVKAAGEAVVRQITEKFSAEKAALENRLAAMQKGIAADDGSPLHTSRAPRTSNASGPAPVVVRPESRSETMRRTGLDTR